MKKYTKFEDAAMMVYRHTGEYMEESKMQKLYRIYRAYAKHYKDFAAFLIEQDLSEI